MQSLNTARRLLAAGLYSLGLLLGHSTGVQAQTGYVALGDSYAAGVGSGGNNLPNDGLTPTNPVGCFRYTHAYPHLLKENLDQSGQPVQMTFLPCSGYTVADIINNAIPLMPNTGVNKVSVTVGGDDVGFENLILACKVTAGIFEAEAACRLENQHVRGLIAGDLAGNLGSLFNRIKSAAPGANIAITGYPRPFAGQFFCYELSNDLRQVINETISQLNQVISSTAAQHGVKFADVDQLFHNHRICDVEHQYLIGWGGTFNDGNILISSYHPNIDGQRTYAHAVKHTLFVTP